jgi:hypothetical protein
MDGNGVLAVIKKDNKRMKSVYPGTSSPQRGQM